MLGARGFAQRVANRFMDEPVTIRHKKDFEKDPANKWGDDTVEFEDELTQTTGWMVSQLTKSVTADGGMADVAETNTIRLPVGTRVGPGDEVSVQGRVWTAVDTSDDETWPAMLKVSLQRTS
jgi:hypothetical protein